MNLSAILIVLASIAITQHALLTTSSLLPSSPINAIPNLAWIYVIFHFALVLGIMFSDLLFPGFHLSLVWPALFLYSSYLYFPTFYALELGSSYPFLYLLAILPIVYLRNRSPRFSSWFSPSSVLVPLIVFLFFAGASTVLSFDPTESVNHYIQIACFALLPFLLAQDLNDEHRWRIAALGGIILGGVIWVMLSWFKFGLLTRDLGWLPAFRYRLFIADVGPNWVSHSVVALFPLSVAFWFLASGRWLKLVWSIVVLGLLFTTAYTQSNWGYSGWIALSLGISIFILLQGQKGFLAWWRRHVRLHVPVLLTSIGVLVPIIFAASWVARQINNYSFYTRLYGWRTFLFQVADHPLFGSGLGVRHITTQYGDRVTWEDVGASFDWLVQQPLSQQAQQLQLGFHTHNLFLELAVGAGLPALAAFLWFLWELGKYSLSAYRRASGEAQILIAGSIAGIVAALGWGLIDVMDASPPFFTTPVWFLVGLLLAAPRAFNLQTANGNSPTAVHKNGTPRFKWNGVFYILCVTFAIVVVILPLLGNFHYRKAYTAYQEHRWAVAADELARASQWEPLNAKYYQLHAEASINLGRYEDAIALYERAVQLKRDFAPYHSQLGWLYWMQGDLEQATIQFQKAVEMDPSEAWHGGLHADLALAYVAKGRIAEAILLLKEAIELDPDMTLAPVLVWIPVQDMDGTFDVVLDPIYFSLIHNSRASGPLQQRILAHLGRADYTSRLFTYEHDALSPNTTISFNEILDVVKADFVAAQASNSQEAPRLLATVAEAARAAGLNTRAEQAYLLYQNNFPKSEYGFRELGNFYRERGRLAEAQVMLERAVQIRPTDVDLWLALAEVYLNRELHGATIWALATAYRLSPINSRLYELRAQLDQQQGDLAQDALNLRKSLGIEESIRNRLALASLYRNLNEQQQANNQCLQAADALQRTWPRPMDSQLWDVGICLAQSNLAANDLTNLKICKSTNEQICNVLLGHIHRIRGKFDPALLAYKAAAMKNPDDGGPHYLLGETYQALGQTEKAEAEYRQSVELDPQESLPLLALGQLQWEKGRKETAIESFRAAVATTPGWGESHTVLGNALLGSNDLMGAGEQYQLAQMSDGDIFDGAVYDFVAHLAEAKIQSPGPDYVRNDYFTIDSQDSSNHSKRQRVLFMHPNSRVSYSVTVPDGAKLAFDVATAPESWTKEGDGVAYAVYIAVDGNTQQVFSTYIDPKHNEIDQRWHPDVIDLSAYAGKLVTVTFETNVGPAGDYRYDWAGWGEPRLMTP